MLLYQKDKRQADSDSSSYLTRCEDAALFLITSTKEVFAAMCVCFFACIQDQVKTTGQERTCYEHTENKSVLTPHHTTGAAVSCTYIR